jgi:hypothetical protein
VWPNDAFQNYLTPRLVLCLPSLQVSKFQEGSDFLFFQSPAPLTSGEFFEAADPPPNFFSGENFRDLQITGPQIAVTVTGVGAFLAVASVIVAPA